MLETNYELIEIKKKARSNKAKIWQDIVKYSQIRPDMIQIWPAIIRPGLKLVGMIRYDLIRPDMVGCG